MDDNDNDDTDNDENNTLLLLHDNHINGTTAEALHRHQQLLHHTRSSRHGHGTFDGYYHSPQQQTTTTTTTINRGTAPTIINNSTNNAAAPPNTTTNTAKGKEILSPMTFAEDATDIIGRFFFGNLPVLDNSGGNPASTTAAASATVSSSTAAAKGKMVASGSASSLSSMASGADGKRGGKGQLLGEDGGGGGGGASFKMNGDNGGTYADGFDHGPGWDQDEIDLWITTPTANEDDGILRSSSTSRLNGEGSVSDKNSSLVTNTTVERGIYHDTSQNNGGLVKDGSVSSDRRSQFNKTATKGDNSMETNTIADEGGRGQDDWVSRRRRMYAQRNKLKRRNWDMLGGNASLPDGGTAQSTTKATNDDQLSLEFPHNNRLIDRASSMEMMNDVSEVNGMKLLASAGGIPGPLTNKNVAEPQSRKALSTQRDQNNASPPEDASRREAEKSKGSQGAVIVDDGKQHWMPDNLCKHCYSCEAPFTLIRRKHHCRLCGMIFCSACSAFFVQISTQSSDSVSKAAKGNYGMMRTCKMCYDHISERGLGVMMRDAGIVNAARGTQEESTEVVDNPKKSSGGTERALNVEKVVDAGTPGPSFVRSNSTILLPIGASTSDPTAAMRTEAQTPSTSSEMTEQFAGFQGSEGASGEFHALSITKQRLDEERRKREEEERAEEEESAAAAAEAEAMSAAESQPAGGSFRLKTRLGGLAKPTVRHLRWKSSSNLESKETKDSSAKTSETIEANTDAVEVSVGVSEEFADESMTSTLKNDDHSLMLPKDDVLPDANEEGGAAMRILESHSGIEEVTGQSQNKDAALSAKIHLGMVAADHLEKLGRELLQTDAPRLLSEIKEASEGSTLVESKLTDMWVNTLMTLATRCCATVEPDVKNGDLLDIRPYCKLKVIPGGFVEDSVYMSGIVFHKNVSHKKMARVIPNAKIMLLSGGIEYTRTENRIASLDTLLEQEERYMEILVTKIFKLKPDVLLVGRSVSRKAQELLLRANIVLIQYVKTTLMNRIARQTGATVLSSTDHVMNQFGSTILGHCRRFRLVAFRDNDVWVDYDDPSKALDQSSSSEPNPSSSSNDKKQKETPPEQKCVPKLLSRNLPNHERQAALAARKLGQGVLDGMDAVKFGLAKRGVVKTYVMIEGCPKELGCTVVLRGASRQALKLVKRVLRFLINAAYNMKLETSYILERCARLPSSYEAPLTPCCSSSLCVNFGHPPNNRKVRPWNGGRNDPAQRSISGKITPLDHQAILITSVWMTDKTQCCPAEVKGICYYSMQDVSLGQFLRDSCFNLSLKCQNPSCKKSVIDHSLSFIHNDGLINITVERMDNPIPKSNLKSQQNEADQSAGPKQENEKDIDGPIATWTYCTHCKIVVTPLVFLSKQTWQWSFGKFLEVYFYNRDAVMNAPGHRCSCSMQKSVLYFGCGSLAARFTYEVIAPYSVFCRRHLPFDESFHRLHSLQELEHISVTSSNLFVKFDKQIEVISRETRELFGSAVNKPDHLQSVLSELNLVSAEVDNASKVLQEKISSVTAKYSKVDGGKRGDAKSEYNEALFNFPWFARRYLFMITSAWNERLSAAGQAVSAMKKIQYSGGSGPDSAVVPTIVGGDASTEDVIEGMKRIRQLQESYLRNYNVINMTMLRSQKGEGGLFEGNILPDGRIATLEQEAELDDEEFYSDPENDIDFEEDIDADVLASRNRVYSPSSASSSKKPPRQRPKKSLGTPRRAMDLADDLNTLQSPPIMDQNPLAFGGNYDSSGQLEMQGKTKTVTAGGAVKSALTRFFNRGGNKEDPYVVDLGLFAKGRPRLQPGTSVVIPVFDDQPSTIIAHSLASSDYDVQFKQFLNASSQSETKSDKYDPSRKDIERRMLGRNKSHIKHTFRDFDEKGQQLCKFVCTTFWSVQFNSVRQAFMNPQISNGNKDSSSSEGVAGSSSSTGSTKLDIEKSYIRSLATSFAWAASGGKSGASFSRTSDDRFVIKCISRTELQMFLDCAPAYFEYLSKAFFHGLPTVLCKIVGVYQIGYHNRVTGKRTMDQVAVMQNIFFGRKISKIFDLKGSLRGRFTRQGNTEKEKSSHTKTVRAKSSHHRRSTSASSSDSESDSSDDDNEDENSTSSSSETDRDDAKIRDSFPLKVTGDQEKEEKATSIPTLLDGDFLEFTAGRPLPLTDRAKAVFSMSILNDTLFLSIINVLDYSILVGIDEKMELVVGRYYFTSLLSYLSKCSPTHSWSVYSLSNNLETNPISNTHYTIEGIIDFMRQYDILKQMERVGKSLPMVVGSEAPTIIQPPLYKARFTNAMERYFMTVPSKWTTI